MLKLILDSVTKNTWVVMDTRTCSYTYAYVLMLYLYLYVLMRMLASSLHTMSLSAVSVTYYGYYLVRRSLYKKSFRRSDTFHELAR